jgi:cytochrome c6
MVRILSLLAVFLATSASAFGFVAVTPTTKRTSLEMSKSMYEGVATTAATALFITAMFAPAASAVDVAAGEELFTANCAACHAGGQNRVVKEKDLQKDTLQKNFGMDPVAIQAFVQNGAVHKGALLFGGTVKSPEDFENVVAYVLDQASENKW